MPAVLPVPLLIVGFGNMGEAIVRGLLRASLLAPQDVCIAEPDAAKLQQAQSLGITSTFTTAVAALTHINQTHAAHGTLLLAVKPQYLALALAGATPLIGPRLVISILAGTPVHTLQSLAGPQARFVRSMPNLPAAIGQGATAIATGPAAADLQVARAILGAIGPCIIEVPEAHLDPFTALAGSGPAYLFHLAEHMLKTGVEMGLTPEQSSQATRQTLLGAAAMLAADSRSPGELRAAVTSKGGTTAAALAVFHSQQMGETIRTAMLAACARGQDLGRGTGSAS
ncbi:MAG: pyrroline-5-carboxylate reductase [Planctomycetota bacterium]|nr:pyrroline-5-carboxylate reductase [Planctomycetota bacterium]